jgi:CheY-like chemotaxis protein
MNLKIIAMFDSSDPEKACLVPRDIQIIHVSGDPDNDLKRSDVTFIAKPYSLNVIIGAIDPQTTTMIILEDHVKTRELLKACIEDEGRFVAIHVFANPLELFQAFLNGKIQIPSNTTVITDNDMNCPIDGNRLIEMIRNGETTLAQLNAIFGT